MAHFRQPKRELASGAARCVDLVVVRVVNDLPLRNKLGRGFSEFLEQHDRQGKVAAGKDSTMLFAGEDVDLREITVGETDVPTTTCAPCSSAVRMLALAVSGFVYSTKTSQGTASASAAEG